MATFFTFATTNYQAKAKYGVVYSHTVEVAGIEYNHYTIMNEKTGENTSYFTQFMEGKKVVVKNGWIYSKSKARNNNNLKVSTNGKEIVISHPQNGTAQMIDTRTGNVILKDIAVSNSPVTVELPADIEEKGIYSIIYTNSETGKRSLVNLFLTPAGIEIQNK